MCAPSEPSVQAWRDLLEQYTDLGDPSRDVDRLLAWIGEESCGSASGLGSQYEVGIFQIDLQDGPAWGGTLATLHGNFSASPTSQKQTRPLTDDEKTLQVTSGVAYVKHCHDTALSRLSAQGLTWSDDDVWCYTKLHHGLPALAANFLPACVRELGTGISWSDFADWFAGLSSDQVAALGLSTRYMPLDRFRTNAERVGYLDGPDGGGVSTMILLVLGVFVLFLFAR